jgi:hypothetical protein
MLGLALGMYLLGFGTAALLVLIGITEEPEPRRQRTDDVLPFPKRNR